jgi:hypothetical protein
MPSRVRTIDWAAFSEHDRLAILYALVGKLSRLHGAGFTAGDTTMANIVLLKGRNPALRSAGQLSRLRPGKDHGLPELLNMLAAFRAAGHLNEKSVKLLLAYYLKSHPNAIEHTREFLIARSKTRHYQAGVPLVDQLYVWFEHYYKMFHASHAAPTHSPAPSSVKPNPATLPHPPPPAMRV